MWRARSVPDEADYKKVAWIRQALADGVDIEIVPIVEDAVFRETEREMIRLYLVLGVDIVNTTKKNAAFVAKRREYMTGKRYSLGKKHSAETRKKMSLGHIRHYRENGHHGTGVPLSAEHKARLSLVLTGRKVADTSNYKKPKSEEHRRNMAEAARRRWACARGEST